VGQRVVIRRVLPGETGPTGGPAFTDVLGVMESWDGTLTTVLTRSGETVAIEIALIVAGKTIPPPPAPRHVRH
jgi:hypothetical protein